MKTLAPLVVGALLVPVVSRFAPTATPGPMHAVLTLLPLVVGAIVVLESTIRRRGGEALHPVEERALVCLTTATVLAAFAWRSLGLLLADWLLYAVLSLCLLYWAARTAWRLRALVSRGLGARPSALFFFLPLVVYIALIPWSTSRRPPDGDEQYNLLIAHSAAYDGDIDLRNNYKKRDWRHFVDHPIEPQPGDPVGDNGEIYSRHSAALPLALAPVYRAAGKNGALVVMALLTATLAWCTMRLLRHHFAEEPDEALLAWSVFALTPPLLLYSYQVWVEIPGALLLVVAVDSILSLRSDRRLVHQKARIVTILFCAAALPLVKMRLGILAGSLLVFLWWRRGRRSRTVAAVAGTLAGLGVAMLVYNAVRFGNPLRVHELDELNLDSGLIGHLTTGLGGLFFDGAFGLFFCAPIWLLLVPGAIEAARKRRELLVDVVILSLPYLSVIGLMNGWYGGWSPPFRFGLVLLPLLTLLLVPVLHLRARVGTRLLVGTLGAATVSMTVVWTLHPGLTYDLANGTMRLSEILGDRLGADVTRLMPSFVRDRTATLVWPIVAVTATGLCWLPRRGGRDWIAAGVASFFVLVAAGATLAETTPTARVEFEDAFVQKSGGEDYPDTWNDVRSRFRISWRLYEADRFVVPVVAGGSRVAIEIDHRYARRSDSITTIIVRAGETELARKTLDESDQWRTWSIGTHDWPEGAPLVVELEGSIPKKAGRSSVIFDQARLDWRDDSG